MGMVVLAAIESLKGFGFHVTGQGDFVGVMVPGVFS